MILLTMKLLLFTMYNFSECMFVISGQVHREKHMIIGVLDDTHLQEKMINKRYIYIYHV